MYQIFAVLFMGKKLTLEKKELFLPRFELIASPQDSVQRFF